MKSNPYSSMTVFAFVGSFIAYSISNIVTFITLGILIPIVFFIVICLIVIPTGLSFVAIQQYYKKKTIESLEKSINEIDEPFKSQLATLIKDYKIRWNLK